MCFSALRAQPRLTGAVHASARARAAAAVDCLSAASIFLQAAHARCCVVGARLGHTHGGSLACGSKEQQSAAYVTHRCRHGHSECVCGKHTRKAYNQNTCCIKSAALLHVPLSLPDAVVPSTLMQLGAVGGQLQSTVPPQPSLREPHTPAAV
jgi:hypothetical protein